MGFTRLNSRVFTNSFAGQNNAAYYAFHIQNKGSSFYGLSRPQYSHQTYYQLAYNGYGLGTNSRTNRWEKSNNWTPISFMPPK